MSWYTKHTSPYICQFPKRIITSTSLCREHNEIYHSNVLSLFAKKKPAQFKSVFPFKREKYQKTLCTKIGLRWNGRVLGKCTKTEENVGDRKKYRLKLCNS